MARSLLWYWDHQARKPEGVRRESKGEEEEEEEGLEKKEGGEGLMAPISIGRGGGEEGGSSW